MHKPRTDFAKKAVVQPVSGKVKIINEPMIKISTMLSNPKLEIPTNNTINETLKNLSNTSFKLTENNIKLLNQTDEKQLNNKKSLINKSEITKLAINKNNMVYIFYTL